MFWRFSKQIKTLNRVLFCRGFCSFHQGTGNSKMLKSWYRASNSKHGTVLIRQLSSSSLSESEVPVIRIPRYMERSIGNAIYKEHRKVKEVREKQAARDKLPPLEPKHVNKLIISWNGDKRLNHYYGYRYDTRKGASEVPLISKQWSKRASVGQQMTFHQFDVNPSLLEVDSSSAADQEKKTFAALGLNENIVAAINQSVTGKTTSPVTPSSIQFGVIPFILARRNVIFSSETGSGKTVAYLAPVIQLIEEQKALDAARFGADYHRRRSPYGLVVLPSRELTEQVGGVARQLSAGTGVGVATMIGGVPKKGEGGAGIAHTGLDLVVTTSGMIESHLNRGVYHLHRLQHVVLDEADTLLDDTFSYEVVDLLENLNIKSSESAEMIESEDDEEDGGGGAFQNLSGTQLICASATLPTTLDSTLGGLLNLAEDVERVTTKALHNLHSNVKHRFYRVGKYERESKLVELLAEDRARGRPVIVFANRTDAADWIYHTLVENDHRAVRLTAAMAEEERLHAFRAFQQGEHDVLVATDLGSRGLDTRRVRHVINYDCPHYVSDYIHRAGRVGRLGSSGEGGGQGAALVTTLVAFKPDAAMVAQLERALRLGGEIQCPNANIKAQLSQRRADKRSKAMRDEV